MYISALFNCMITHCYVPDSFCISTIIPIPKGSNKSTSTVKNYRGIALSSLLSKIFDNCIISLQESCLRTAMIYNLHINLKLLQYNAYLQLPR